MMRRFLLLVVLAAGACGGAALGASVASAATLEVTLGGSGTGTVVSSNPSGINCSNVSDTAPSACFHDFGDYFGTGTLTATPGEGSAFLGWSGDAGWGSTCTGSTNPCTTGFLYYGALTATARFAPAPDAPTVVTGAAGGVVFPSATVAGTVNPGSDDFGILDCRFEYGLTAAYGSSAPCEPRSIGPGTSPVAVSASIGVLQPGQTYHYRLVASNGSTTRGADQTFTSDTAPADSCPNAGIRAQQGALAQRLGDCGAYELVSPDFTGGQVASANVGTADGNHATLNSAGGFAGTENLNDASIRYATTRTDTGWRTTAIAPPGSLFPYLPAGAARDWTRDGSRSLWLVNLRADEGTRRFTPVVRDPDGTFHVAGVTQDQNEDEGGVLSDGYSTEPVGTTEDLLTVAQQTRRRPALADGTVDSRPEAVKSLYLSTYRPNGTLAVRQVAYRDGATMFPDCTPALGGSSTARNAISADGGKVFFTMTCDPVDPDAQRVWAKVGDADPIDLSASHCPAECGPTASASFRGASRDGSRVYFSTTQRLLPEDPDENDAPSADLYEYDFNVTGSKLRLVTGVGEGGTAFFTVSRISDDGAYVYFLARGSALAGENARGVAPQPGAPSLYVSHRAAGQAEPTIKFVAPANYDPNLLGQASSNGRFLLYQTTANPTGDKLPGDAFPDLYRYDARDDDLRRVWSDAPAHNGARRVGTSEFALYGESAPFGGMQSSSGWYSTLQVSDDGSKVGFSTVEPLSRDDHNTRNDAYLWHADSSRVELLTDGTSAPGNRAVGSSFAGMTPSGDSMFVTSASPLLKEHKSGQIASYVIRRDGGFPASEAPAEPCAGDACQGEGVAPPPLLAGTGSTTVLGDGNVVPGEMAPSKQSAGVRVEKAKTVRGSSARITVRVAGKGRIRISGSGLKQSYTTAKKAGSYRVVVKLSKRARRTLASKNRVQVHARVQFTPVKGKSSSTRVRVTFRTKQQGRASSRPLRRVSVLSSDARKGR